MTGRQVGILVVGLGIAAVLILLAAAGVGDCERALNPAIECWPPDAQDRRPVLYGIGAIVGIGAVILAFSPLGRGD